MSALLEAVVLVPLVVAFAIAWRRTRRVALAVASWAALPALIVAAIAPSTEVEYRSLLFGVRLVLDTQSRAFLALTAGLWLCAGIYGARYLADDARRGRFTAFFLAALCGNLGLVLAHDLASFYTLFALMSFASYGLVVHPGDDQARRAGRVYIAFLVAGETLLLAGFVLLYAHTSATVPASPQLVADRWAAWLLFVGFGSKTGVLLLHVWLPLAYTAAPTPASAALSGAMINAGVIGWLRFVSVDAAGADAWALACAILGIAAALYGVLIGIAQRDPKTVLAYSSVSQMGLVTLAFGLALLAPDAGLPVVLAYAVHHGIAKAALFLAVGLAAVAAGRARRAMLFAGIAIAAAALAGAPATSGALLKSALGATVDVAGSSSLAWIPAALSVASIATTVLMARFVWLIVPLPIRERPAGPAMWLPWLVLLVALAVSPAWMIGTTPWLDALTLPKIVASAWPLVLGLALAALAHRLAQQRHWRLPAVPPGDLVVVFERLVRAAFRALATLNSAIAAVDAMLLAIPRVLRLPHVRVERVDVLLRTSPIAGLLLLVVVGLLLFA